MWTIRAIHPDEWPTYRALRLRALQDSPDAFGSTYEVELARSNEVWASRMAAAATSGRDRAMFAAVGENVCGLAWCKVSASEPGFADLFQMWVQPDCRGQGIGAALLQEAIAYASHAGASTLRLGVAVAESPAMRLYRSFGFRPVGMAEPLRKGSAVTAQNMHLQLSVAA